MVAPLTGSLFSLSLLFGFLEFFDVSGQGREEEVTAGFESRGTTGRPKKWEDENSIGGQDVCLSCHFEILLLPAGQALGNELSLSQDLAFFAYSTPRTGDNIDSGAETLRAPAFAEAMILKDLPSSLYQIQMNDRGIVSTRIKLYPVALHHQTGEVNKAFCSCLEPDLVSCVLRVESKDSC